MAKITFLVLGLATFFLQGYFLRDALFKFIPLVSEAVRRKTASRGLRFLIKPMTIIVAGIILLLVLPGFLQAGVILILDISREDLGIAKSSIVGWLFGILAKGLMTQGPEEKSGKKE